MKATGPHLPLSWRVPGAPNFDVPGFGMPSYVGREETRGHAGEAIACLGALLGGQAVGIDRKNLLELTPQYLNHSEEVILNNPGAKSGESFWYDLLPSIDFVQLSSRYPEWKRGRQIARGVADRYAEAIRSMSGDFDHTGFSLGTMKPVDNGRWQEPDSAAGIAYLELHEGLASGDEKYIAAARNALRSLQDRDDNPTYEVLTAYGALSAAYLNAEKGEHWDVPRFVDWCFEPTSPNRVGWGMIVGHWGGQDVGGLMGSTNDGGGYAFAMNTFLNAATLTPIARYDDRYSAAVGKWMLNLASASRLFYRDSLPRDHQSSADWPGDAQHGIAYEGLRRSWEGKSPYATGDAKRDDPTVEDLGLYGGGYVGLLGALIRPTNVPMILSLDLRATDYLPTRGYPTSLLWNSYADPKAVKIDLGETPVRPYDAVGNRFLTEGAVRGSYTITMEPKQAIQVVSVPAFGEVTYLRNRSLVNGIAIDFNNGRVPLPAPTHRDRPDHSVSVAVPRVGGDAESQPITLSGGAGGTMRAELSFTWDMERLYFRIRQTSPETETVEATDPADFQKHSRQSRVSFGRSLPIDSTSRLDRIPEARATRAVGPTSCGNRWR